MNYERLVQWLAGPFSAAIAWGATAIVHSTISKATALTVATFVLSSGATILAHFKWASNLAKWWHESGVAAPAGLLSSEADAIPGPEPSETKYVSQAPDTTPSMPDKSGIPREDGPLLSDSADSLPNADEFADQPPEQPEPPSPPMTTIENPAPPITSTTSTDVADVPDVADQGDAPAPISENPDPTEKLRNQLRAAGIEPEV